MPSMVSPGWSTPVGGHVGLGAGVRLHVGMFGPEQRLGALAGPGSPPHPRSRNRHSSACPDSPPAYLLVKTPPAASSTAWEVKFSLAMSSQVRVLAAQFVAASPGRRRDPPRPGAGSALLFGRNVLFLRRRIRPGLEGRDLGQPPAVAPVLELGVQKGMHQGRRGQFVGVAGAQRPGCWRRCASESGRFPRRRCPEPPECQALVGRDGHAHPVEQTRMPRSARPSATS